MEGLSLLNSVSKKPPTLAALSEDAQSVFDLLSSETDMAVALIGASYIDATLAIVLSGQFRKSDVSTRLLDPSGRLGELNVRADLAYALQLINKASYQDIVTIARIRNRFAHDHTSVSFSSPEIADLCTQFRFATGFLAATSEQDVTALDWVVWSARNRYSLTVSFLSQKLLMVGVAESARISAPKSSVNE